MKSRNSLKCNTVLNGGACCCRTVSTISKLTGARKCVWWHLRKKKYVYCRLLVPCVGSWFTLTGKFDRSRHTVRNTLYFLLFRFTGRRDSHSFHWFFLFLITALKFFVSLYPSTYPGIWHIYLEWMKAVSLFPTCVSSPRGDKVNEANLLLFWHYSFLAVGYTSIFKANSCTMQFV